MSIFDLDKKSSCNNGFRQEGLEKPLQKTFYSRVQRLSSQI